MLRQLLWYAGTQLSIAVLTSRELEMAAEQAITNTCPGQLRFARGSPVSGLRSRRSAKRLKQSQRCLFALLDSHLESGVIAARRAVGDILQLWPSEGPRAGSSNPTSSGVVVTAVFVAANARLCRGRGVHGHEPHERRRRPQRSRPPKNSRQRACCLLAGRSGGTNGFTQEKE